MNFVSDVIEFVLACNIFITVHSLHFRVFNQLYIHRRTFCSVLTSQPVALMYSSVISNTGYMYKPQ